MTIARRCASALLLAVSIACSGGENGVAAGESALKVKPPAPWTPGDPRPPGPPWMP